MKQLKEYFKLQKEIYKYFGYQEDWKIIPLDDCTDDYWMLIEHSSGGGRYVTSPEPFTVESIEAGEKIFGGVVYTQRFLPKWVYRREKYTMVCADTQTDGNKVLMVLSNDKEETSQELKDLYNECW